MTNNKENNIYNKSLEEFFKEKGVNIKDRGLVNEYAYDLAFKMREDDLADSVFQELDYLKKHAEENKELVNSILYTIRQTLRQLDAREKHEINEKLEYEDEEQKYRDQVFDYYNDDFSEYFDDMNNEKRKSY